MRIHRFVLTLLLLASLVPLASCGSSQTLSNVGLSQPVLRPSGNGESVAISYTVGRPASVSIYVEDAQGKRYTLRDSQSRLPSTDPYTMRFDGTVPTGDPTLVQR